MKTKASLLFDELNRRYWRGRLPKYRVIRRDLSRDELDGYCDDNRRTIVLHKDLADEDLRRTLLHEVCHIGSGPKHGPRFQRKLDRLIKLGESKLLGDVECYDGTAFTRYAANLPHPVNKISFRQAVISEIDSFAIDQYRRRWPRVLRYFARKYEMTPAQFQRKAPWAERVWRESAADYRSSYEQSPRKHKYG